MPMEAGMRGLLVYKTYVLNKNLFVSPNLSVSNKYPNYLLFPTTIPNRCERCTKNENCSCE